MPDGDFLRRLHNLDPYLIAYWNPLRGRWTIDRYTCETDHTHHNGCPRVHVMLVQGEDGSYRPLNDRLLDDLRKWDMWKSTVDAINSNLDQQKEAFDRGQQENVRLYVKDTIHDEHIHQESNLTAN